MGLIDVKRKRGSLGCDTDELGESLLRMFEMMQDTIAVDEPKTPRPKWELMRTAPHEVQIRPLTSEPSKP
jgi:hypothetical protein